MEEMYPKWKGKPVIPSYVAVETYSTWIGGSVWLVKHIG